MCIFRLEMLSREPIAVFIQKNLVRSAPTRLRQTYQVSNLRLIAGLVTQSRVSSLKADFGGIFTQVLDFVRSSERVGGASS